MSYPPARGNVPASPDFAELFAVCGCGREECPRCEEEWITPRTAAWLWVAAGLLVDRLTEDLAAGHVGGTGSAVHDGEFVRLPRVARGRDFGWRYRFIQAVRDLGGDLAAGRPPVPRCTAEEMALYLIIQDAPDLPEVAGEYLTELCAPLPATERDGDWDMLDQVLFQDHDVRMLLSPALDGIEDPADPTHRSLGMGLLQPEEWFVTFGNQEPREPGAPEPGVPLRR